MSIKPKVFEAPCNVLNSLPAPVNLNLNSHPSQQSLEARIQTIVLGATLLHTEQEAEVELVMIWVDTILRKDGVVGSEEGAEGRAWEGLRGCDN